MTVLGVHPARLDLAVHPGDPVDFTVSVLDSDGVAENLTGWTVAARAVDPAGAVLHTFTATGSSAGVITVSATSAETALWLWSVYAARLVVTATPSDGPPVITTGWVRLYRP